MAALTIRAPQQHRPENAATLAGIAVFVVTAAFAPALVRPALGELFLGYTPHYLGVLVGLAAGFLALVPPTAASAPPPERALLR